jgi:hypothetical protein
MTGGALFFNRTGAKIFVAAGALLVKRISELGSFFAAGALLVKRISELGSFFITFIRVMAFNALLGLIILIFGKGVVAVTT